MLIVFLHIIDRFLACSKSGIDFADEEVDLFSKSWVKSCETTGKLFQFVTTLQPHETKKTLSLNEARSCIIAMSKPMAQAVQLIEINLKKIKDVKDQCKVDDDDIKKIMKNLKFKAFELEIKQLPYPRTVCAAEGCKRYVNVGESAERNTLYPQICHTHCYLKGIPFETTNNEQLRDCKAMSGGNCTVCKHDFRFHMHITYTATLVEKEFLSSEALRKIQEKSEKKSQKEDVIAMLERRIKELEEEKEIIFDSASLFGVFLKENAIVPYNDSFSEYLDMLIKEEGAKEEVIIDRKRIEQLKNDKKTYEEKKGVIMKNIASGAKGKKDVIPVEEVYQVRQQLCSLKQNGNTLEEALGIVHLQNCNFLEISTGLTKFSSPRRFAF